MKIDPESRALQGASTFISFVVLNVLYVLTCLPVVTIGAATAALDEVAFRYADEERGRPVFDYLPAFGRNFARGTAVFLALMAPAALLAFTAVFWLVDTGLLSIAAAILTGAASVYLFAAFLHGAALVATFDNTIRRTIRNALLLPGAEPLRTFGIVILPITGLSLVVIMPTFGFIIATIGFSVGAYASSFLFKGIYNRIGQPE